MKAHVVEIDWKRDGSAFTDHKYSRAHVWRFDGGAEVPASSSPDIVRLPFSDPRAVDPEEAYVASLSSCHMLWFLDLVARDGYVVDRYVDHAEGFLTRNDHGKLWLSRVVLAPRVRFSGSKLPTDAIVDDLHHRAHEECFLANAVRTEIVMQASWVV
jgi:organic hydroperoxide reductase OsmC/OhrA